MFYAFNEITSPPLSCLRIAKSALILVSLLWPLWASTSAVVARQSVAQGPSTQRNILIEVYVSDGQAESDAARAAIERISQSRPGLQAVVRSITDNPDAQGKLKQIAEFYHFDAGLTPLIYGCGQVIRSGKSAEEFEALIGDMLKLEVFTQVGCPHCDTAHAYLDEFSKSYPGLEIVYRSISEDPAARNEMNHLSRALRTAVPETPVFHLCNQLMVGFEPAQFPGDRLRHILKKWTIDEVPARKKAENSSAGKGEPSAAKTGVSGSIPFATVAQV